MFWRLWARNRAHFSPRPEFGQASRVGAKLLPELPRGPAEKMLMCNVSPAFWMLCSILILWLCAGASGQQSPSPASAEILIPLVVTDSSGTSVSGLQPSEFLLKVGREEVLPEKAEEVRPFLLPPDKSGRQSQPVFIVVDRLVPASTDIVRSVERPVLRFLAHSLKNGPPVTLLTIDADGLNLVHSFDTPAPVLAAALELLDRKTHILGGNFKSAAASNVPNNLQQMVGDELASLEQFAATRWSMYAFPFRGYADPFAVQMDALHKLADLCGKMPGRKAAFWITGSSATDTVSTLSPRTDEQRSKDKEYESAIEALNEGQISMFPVTMLPNGFVIGGLAFNEADFRIRHLGFFDFLQQVARSTGGDLLYLERHIGSSIRPGLTHFSSYYLLSYQLGPPPKEAQWRKLELSVKRPDVHVRSMDGFFALP